MTPERDLAVRVLAQAWKDTRAPERWIRQDALRFWQDTAAVRFWGQVLDTEDTLLHAAATLLTTPGARERHPGQLSLFGLEVL
jgi:hypothetical protein